MSGVLRSPLLRHFFYCFNNLKERILIALDFPSHLNDYGTPTIVMNVEDGIRYPIPVNHQPVLDSIVGNGMLWAVPTSRRTVVRRLTRKLAVEKLMKPKKNLPMCTICGHFHEAHTICGNCYQKVREETELMKEAIQQEWKFDNVDKDVIVVYDNDAKDDGQHWNGKRIIEMKRERPEWFHQNLRIKTKNHDATTETNLQPGKGVITQDK